MSAERKRILLAELEDRLAIGLWQGLYARNTTHDVLVARSADTARALLQSDRFALVVTRAQAHKANKLEELCANLPSRAQTRIAALLDSDPRHSTEALYTAGADRILNATAPSERLAEELVEASQWNTLLCGELEQLCAPDLIQSLCLARRSLAIRIVTAERSAVVWLEGGEIHHAVCGNVAGQSAIAMVMNASRGQFWAMAAPAPQRTIEREWQHVLLEAARIGDEEAEWPDTPPQAPVRPVSGVHRLTYRELTDLGLQNMKAGDLPRAREFWAAARELADENTDETPPALSSEA
jgi:hypothetical protein